MLGFVDQIVPALEVGGWGVDVQAVANEGRFTTDELQIAVRQGVKGFVNYSLRKRKRPIAYWRRLVYFFARQTPKFVKRLLKKNMSPGLGKVLDYRGVPMAQAVGEIQVQGIEVNEDEMQQIEAFLLAFHKKFKSS